MPKFCPLFSSSKGNCEYISTKKTGILIDAGVSAKRIDKALSSIDADTDNLKAIFITHEHIDHIAGLRVFAKKHKLPVYATKGTCEEIYRKGFNNGDYELREMSYEGVYMDDIFIKPFKISHDASEPVGYTITFEDDRKLAVATDTGIITEEMKNALLGVETILLESNYDVSMLKCGPYSYNLVLRILGERGHLSNEVSSSFSSELLENGCQRFILGHLSQQNNLPQIAFLETKNTLENLGATENSDFILKVAKPEWDEKAMVF